MLGKAKVETGKTTLWKYLTSVPNGLPTLAIFGFYQRGVQGITDKISLLLVFLSKSWGSF